MKSGNAVMMALMRDFADTSHDVGLMLTGDEEIGGMHGTPLLLEQGYSCDAVIIPDGGEAVENLITKGKGILKVTFSAEGRAAHGSLPWKGRNALILLIEALQRAQTLFVPLTEHPRDHWVTTMNTATMHAGNAFNQVPGLAVAECDIRFTEQEQLDSLIERLKENVPREIRVTTEILAQPFAVSPEHPLVRAFIETLRALHLTPRYTQDHGASDGRFFANRGIPVLISQPDGGDAHGPEEWVSLDGIERYYGVLRKYLDRVAQ